MKKYIIDTNALISFVTDRNPEQQDKIAPLFEQASQLKVLILCHQHVLTEFIYVMEKVYQIPKAEISRMVADLVDMPGTEVVHAVDFKWVLSHWPTPVPDFGDAVVASVCKNTKGAAVMTFDRKFMDILNSFGLKYQGS